MKFSTRAQWRRWLEKHHQSEPEIWLEFVKAHTGRRTFSYVEAVEEAICFGWIDTTVRRIDDEHYIQRFTPRANDRNWSKINIERFDRMEREGRMTDAGRARRASKLISPRKRLQVDDPVPPFIADELRKHPKALAFFETLAPGYRRDYLRWISEPKREETRAKRLAEAIRKLESGVKRWT